MEEKTGFFEVSPGNKSSSRLGSFIVVCIASIFAGILLIAGLGEDELSVIPLATGVGEIFILIAGPAMVFMFQQKKQEKK